MADERRDPIREKSGGFGGILRGLADLVEKLGELAEKGEALSPKPGSPAEKEIKGVYGFSLKIGLGGKSARVEPFGNIRKDEKKDQLVVQEIREPLVDVFEEEDHILIVAEMPGIGSEDLHVDLAGDILTLRAERKEKKYYKEILLRESCSPENLKFSCNNGVVEIRCFKQRGS